MAKRLLLLCLLLLAVSLSYGQDLITRSDGVVLQATVLEMKPGLVRFKLFGQADTLVYQISTQDVESVRMADGTIRTFPEAAAAKKAAEPFNYETSSGQNILWYYPFELVYPTFAMAYERIASSGKIGFKIPLMIGLSGNSSNNSNTGFRENTRFGTGLDLNIYPFGQGRFQLYVGPVFHYRTFRSYYYLASQPGPHKENDAMFALALKMGMYYQFSRFFIISVDGGPGYRFFREPERPEYYDPEGRSHQFFIGNFHLGFRF